MNLIEYCSLLTVYLKIVCVYILFCVCVCSAIQIVEKSIKYCDVHNKIPECHSFCKYRSFVRFILSFVFSFGMFVLEEQKRLINFMLQLEWNFGDASQKDSNVIIIT